MPRYRGNSKCCKASDECPCVYERAPCVEDQGQAEKHACDKRANTEGASKSEDHDSPFLKRRETPCHMNMLTPITTRSIAPTARRRGLKKFFNVRTAVVTSEDMSHNAIGMNTTAHAANCSRVDCFGGAYRSQTIHPAAKTMGIAQHNSTTSQNGENGVNICIASMNPNPSIAVGMVSIRRKKIAANAITDNSRHADAAAQSVRVRADGGGGDSLGFQSRGFGSSRTKSSSTGIAITLAEFWRRAIPKIAQQNGDRPCPAR